MANIAPAMRGPRSPSQLVYLRSSLLGRVLREWFVAITDRLKGTASGRQ
jgi:hypothetical protein